VTYECILREEAEMPLFSVTDMSQESLTSILTELAHESARAAAIVGAVLVEESLTNLLKSRLNRDQGILDDVFRPSGPMGTFSTKIKMGFLMGLYSPETRRELDTIREIRNEFAHKIARSFDIQHIRDLANNLSRSEQVEFYVRPGDKPTDLVLYIGPGSKPADYVVEPVLPAIKPEDLSPRERYLRACQFYNSALVFLGMVTPPHSPTLYF
jgi:hypothetical protein